ncbi:hypothetical protein [Peribacillus asahii]|uniref:hypothetical protein n=1 Tax=Peribacillus asahii TaxID=228899 RepID=UPI0020792C09|nr:hypothetical protein [Peribacillus asahii]USK68571.1 hypothetical protein LIS76_13275 [Peribacillus asahii]
MEVYVAAGETLEELRSAYLQSYGNGELGQQEMPVPKEWPDYIQERMNQAYAAWFKAMGIERDN